MNPIHDTNQEALPFYLTWAASPNNPHFNLCFYYTIKQKPFVSQLMEALQTLVRRSPYLRQTFSFDKHRLIATVHEQLMPTITEYEALSKKEAFRFIHQTSRMPHDLHHRSAIKIGIIRCHRETYVVFNIHHIIMDGTTLDAFITELNELLDQNSKKTGSSGKANQRMQPYLNSKKQPFKSKTRQSEAYIHRITDWLKKEDSLPYFSPSSYQQTILDDNAGSHHKRTMPAELFHSLNRFSTSLSLSLFNLLLLFSHAFIAKILNKTEVVITYPIRTCENAINGCFVTVVPFIIDVKEDVLHLIRRYKNNMPLYKAVARMQHRYDSTTLHQLPSFSQSNIAKPLPLLFEKNAYESEPLPHLANSILSIKYRVLESTAYFTCDVSKYAFPDYFSKTILDRFFHFIEKLLQDTTKKITHTSILLDHEQRLLLSHIPKHPKQPINQRSICDIIEHHARKSPNDVALVHNHTNVSYFELNAKANQIARYLLNTHIKARSSSAHNGLCIALFLSRTPLFIASMLAVLKLKASYVCLSKQVPNQRLQFILNDTASEIIITELALKSRIKPLLENAIPCVTLNEPDAEYAIQNNLIDDLTDKPTATNVAHMIYTSGTTGVPKGIVIHHNNVISLVTDTDYIHITKRDAMMWLSDVSFDATTFEIWGALLNGARLLIPTDRLELFSNIKRFKEIIACHQITIILLTKTIFDQMYQNDPTAFSAIQWLLIGGEALNKTLIKQLASSKHKPRHLLNAYGPTENTTISTVYEIDARLLAHHSTVPIGKAISNRIAIALDVHKNIMPPGLIGELYVGGAGLSSGYLHQIPLSLSKFSAIPLHPNHPTVLYQTGDWVRTLPDGNLEYLGRDDRQIKLRGFRIELCELEQSLARYPGITRCTALLSTEVNTALHDPFLMVYYQTANHDPIEESLLSHYLKQTLPDYMVPSVFTCLQEWPITLSGKLDIKQFPIIHRDSSLITHDKPTNAKERILCNAFETVLQIRGVGIHHDFFELGGNSILAIELASILHNRFDVHVSDVFHLRTPFMIAEKKELLTNNLEKTIRTIKNNVSKNNLKNNPNHNNNQIKSSIEHPFEVIPREFRENLVLTGATGYLGCNLLNALLTQTQTTLWLLVRADSVELAREAIYRKFLFYFDSDLRYTHQGRLCIIQSDLEQDYLGLPIDQYEALLKKTDGIIHCAALTKHYGNYQEFYSANVQATINLLAFCKKTSKKIFHFISTLSTLDDRSASSNSTKFFTEDDHLEQLHHQTNHYIKTKHEAEQHVLLSRKDGILSNIYRVGNLAFIYENFRVQENIDDNAFFTRIKCLLTLGITAQEIGLEEISPVDLTAKAIVKLINQPSLCNATFHIFNPNLCNISDYLVRLKSKTVQMVSIHDFLDQLLALLATPNDHQTMIMRFLLHQNWLDGSGNSLIINRVLQTKTSLVLKKLGFEWPTITLEDFEAVIIKSCASRDIHELE